MKKSILFAFNPNAVETVIFETETWLKFLLHLLLNFVLKG